MSSGYVVDSYLSNLKFQHLVNDAVSKDITDARYELGSNSKANRLRKFLQIENDFTVGALLDELGKYWLVKAKKGELVYSHNEMQLYDELQTIINRLKSNNIVSNVEAIVSSRKHNDGENIKVFNQYN